MLCAMICREYEEVGVRRQDVERKQPLGAAYKRLIRFGAITWDN